MLEKILKNNCFKIFALIMSFMFCILFLYTSCKILKIQHCLNLVYVASVVFPLGIYFIFFDDSKKNRIICSLVFSFLVLIIPFLFSWTYDYTADGNSYHKMAIGFMKEGWNPIYESSLDWQINKDVIQIDPVTNINKWIDHYPKATWTMGATMYSYTGSIESGKSINFLLMVSAGLLLYSFFSTKFSKKISLLFSLLLIINPVLLSQMFSYYLDGLMGICFTIEFILLVLLDVCDKKSWLLWFLLLCDCSIFVNLKFTGLLYSGITAAVFYFYWLFKDKKNFWKIFKYITIRFSALFIIATCFIGLNSYVRNTIDHHNPLYPLIGKDKVDIITTMQPKVFGEINSIQKFTWSLFSKTENITYFSGDPNIKFPFMLYNKEIHTIYESPDIRIAGFGPFYAASFIIGLVFLIYGIVVLIRNKNRVLKYFVMALISIIACCIAVKECWWARYIPQFYCIPVMGLIILEYLFKGKKKCILQIILSLVLFANICCFLCTYPYRFRDFTKTRSDLVELSNMEKVNLDFDVHNLPFGVYFNLKDYKVKFNLITIDEDEPVRWFYSWKVRVKLDD